MEQDDRPLRPGTSGISGDLGFAGEAEEIVTRASGVIDLSCVS